MGAIVGVAIGYAIGTRAGEQGWSEFRDAWKVITTSAEVRELASGGFSMARSLMGRGSEMLAEVLGGTEVSSVLRAA